MKVAIVLLCALFGLAASAATGRIIGGTSASDGQFPYMASLRSQQNSHFCGGFIYNTQWIVSAAHCTVGRTPENTISLIGTHNLANGGFLVETEEIRNHPNYNANTLENDISLIRTNGQMTMTTNVQALRIGTTSIGAGTIGVVTAWGMTSNPGYTNDIMQWVSLATLTNRQCRRGHTTANGRLVNNSNICTNNEVGVGMCIGGSSGTLAAGGTAVGIYSWGIPCATGAPDVYTRISSYANWIHSVGGEQ